jgi:hypothetical protein
VEVHETDIGAIPPCVVKNKQLSTVLLATTVAAIVAIAALLATVGADARWLAALGHAISTKHAIPAGVPFAGAPTGHWTNAIALAELIFNALERGLGDRGLMLAQLLATGIAVSVLARDSLAAGASAVATSGALLIAALGALPSLSIARVQLFSLILFPVLLALLRAEVRRPSWRIWLVVPLLAVWSNLHGAVVLGLLLVLVYLLFSRGRLEPLASVGVAVAATCALLLTPALFDTVAYYHGLLTNLAAQRGLGLWGPLSLSAPLDLLLIVCAAALGWWCKRVRLPLWEAAVLFALLVLTVHAGRNGVWLLFFLVAPAASALHPKRTWLGLVPVVGTAAVAAIAFAVVRGPVAHGASRPLLANALALAHGSPVLAGNGIDEQVALAGGRIWVGNPIDAFSRGEQAAYLDWLSGEQAGLRALDGQVRVVLVLRGSSTQRLMNGAAGFVVAGGDRTSVMYEKVK